ncbi:MAG: DNA ligase, partial [Ignavibacteriales bacterium]
EFLPNLSPQEIKITAYLLRGEVGPSFEALEFNLAQNMVIRALTQAYQLPEQKIKIALFKFGDLGIVAENLSKRKGDHLTITEVFNSLQEITRISGKGSQKLKLDRLVELLSQASGQEAKYIVRTILGTHRIGVADMTFLSGLAQGFTGKRENKAVLESAYNIMSDLGEVAFRLTDKGLDALKQVLPVPGIPIRMMLASRVADLDEVSSHITGSMFVEYKYDGERVQIHKDKKGRHYSLFKTAGEHYQSVSGDY